MTPLEFGLPVLVELPGLDECAKTAKEMGFSFVELNASFPQYQPTEQLLSRALYWQKETGLYFTLHLDEQLNPFDFNERVADTYLQNTLECLRFAKALHMKRVNMHLLRGVYVTLPEKRIFLNQVYESEYLSHVRAFRDACVKELAGSDTLLCVENTDGFLPYHLDALSVLLESPYFGLTLDTGHDMALQHLDWPVYERLENRLHHMHLHSCTKGDPHKPLDEGDVNVPQMLALAHKTGSTCLIEVKTVAGLRRSAAYLKAKEEM